MSSSPLSHDSVCEDTYGDLVHEGSISVSNCVVLTLHLPVPRLVVYSDGGLINQRIPCVAAEETQFLKWLKYNQDNMESRALTYTQFSSKYVWDPIRRVWNKRTAGTVNSRLVYIPDSKGELYYLRTLLLYVKGPTSFDAIRTINGITYPTFKMACTAMGVVEDPDEFAYAIYEAVQNTSMDDIGGLLRSMERFLGPTEFARIIEVARSLLR